MIFFNINIYVTSKEKSIRSEARDSSVVKGISSGAKWKAAVIAFLPWVGRMLWSFFVKDDNES